MPPMKRPAPSLDILGPLPTRKAARAAAEEEQEAEESGSVGRGKKSVFRFTSYQHEILINFMRVRSNFELVHGSGSGSSSTTTMGERKKDEKGVFFRMAEHLISELQSQAYLIGNLDLSEVDAQMVESRWWGMVNKYSAIQKTRELTGKERVGEPSHKAKEKRLPKYFAALERLFECNPSMDGSTSSAALVVPSSMLAPAKPHRRQDDRLQKLDLPYETKHKVDTIAAESRKGKARATEEATEYSGEDEDYDEDYEVPGRKRLKAPVLPDAITRTRIAEPGMGMSGSSASPTAQQTRSSDVCVMDSPSSLRLQMQTMLAEMDAKSKERAKELEQRMEFVTALKTEMQRLDSAMSEAREKVKEGHSEWGMMLKELERCHLASMKILNIALQIANR